MKIAHIVSTFYPHVGGMGAVVYDEARGLAARGHQVTVFTMQYPGDSETEARDGFTISRISPLIRMGDGGIVLWGDKLANFDVVHVHVPWYGSMFGALYAAQKFNCPVVATLHMAGSPIGTIKNIFKEMDELLTLPKLKRVAKKLFVVNKQYFDSRNNYWKNVIELPNPIDTNLFTLGDRSRGAFTQFPTNSKIILFVGNLMPIKKLDVLLRAVAAGDSSWRLVVAGSGYAEAEYRALAEGLGIADNVSFFGSVPREKMSALFRGADVVAVPSATESFSLVAIEALACGTPVVASNVPGLRDSIAGNPNTRLFTAGNATMLAERIREILNIAPEQQVQFGKAGAEQIRARYSLDEHVRILENEYKATLQ